MIPPLPTDRPRRIGRTAVAAGPLAVLAGLGMVFLYIGITRHGTIDGNDLIALNAPKALLSGTSVHAAFGPGHLDAYPLPMELLLIPIAAVPDGVRIPLVKVLCMILLASALWLWADGSGKRSSVLVLLLSMPALSLILHDHLVTALGLTAVSLAVWAQRRQRFVLAGAALAVGAFRTANFLPVAVMLAVSVGPRWKDWLRFGGGLGAVLAPLTLAAFVVDPNWVADWQADLRLYPLAGLVRLVAPAGTAGVIGAQVAVAGLAGVLVRRSFGRPIDLDRASLGLAIGILPAPMDGIYSCLFVLPAVLRAGLRPGYGQIPYLTAAGSWIFVLVAAPWLLSAAPEAALSLLTTVAFWLLLNTYPLLRRVQAVGLTATASSD